MSISNGTSENKLVFYSPDSIVAPFDVTSTIYQGDRLSLSSGKVIQQTDATNDWIGVADFQNPIASLGYYQNQGVGGVASTVGSGRILLAGNVVYFYAPATETFSFGDGVYCLGYGTGYNYPQAVTKVTTGSPKLVGYFVGLADVAGGTGVRIPVKIAPTASI